MASRACSLEVLLYGGQCPNLITPRYRRLGDCCAGVRCPGTLPCCAWLLLRYCSGMWYCDKCRGFGRTGFLLGSYPYPEWLRRGSGTYSLGLMALERSLEHTWSFFFLISSKRGYSVTETTRPQYSPGSNNSVTNRGRKRSSRYSLK